MEKKKKEGGWGEEGMGWLAMVVRESEFWGREKWVGKERRKKIKKEMKRTKNRNTIIIKIKNKTIQK